MKNNIEYFILEYINKKYNYYLHNEKFIKIINEEINNYILNGYLNLYVELYDDRIIDINITKDYCKKVIIYFFIVIKKIIIKDDEKILRESIKQFSYFNNKIIMLYEKFIRENKYNYRQKIKIL